MRPDTTVNPVEATANKVVDASAEPMRFSALASRQPGPRLALTPGATSLGIADCMIAMEKRTPYNRPVFQGSSAVDFRGSSRSPVISYLVCL